MPSPRGFAAPVCLRLPHADIGAVTSLDLDSSQVSRFLGPVADIIRAVRGGPSHSLVALFADGEMVGFYVVHPDPRDASRWWLGWLAIGSRFQGRGLGRAALSSALLRLASIPGCRSIRLLVAPDNMSALALYTSEGFVHAGIHSGGEQVLEFIPAEAHPVPSRSDGWAMVPASVRARTSRRRVRSTVGPHAARVICVVRGPPVLRVGWTHILAACSRAPREMPMSRSSMSPISSSSRSRSERRRNLPTHADTRSESSGASRKPSENVLMGNTYVAVQHMVSPRNLEARHRVLLVLFRLP